MIPIRRKNLQQLAERHYESIMEYTQRGNLPFSENDIVSIECWLKDKFEINFKELIFANPEELDRIAQLFTDLKYDEKTDKNKKTFKLKDIDFLIVAKIGDLYGIFSHKNSSMKIVGEDTKYNGTVFASSLGLTVCPYCNRNFINEAYSYKEESDPNNGKEVNEVDRRTCQLDHFYPKAHFPLLAMSFYNLVPSCTTCNFIKNDKTDVNKFYNPYDTRFDGNTAFRFKLKISSSEFYYKKESIDIFYSFKDKLSHEEKLRVDANLIEFRIKGLYENHKDFVLEMIQKNIVYSDSYIDELYKNYEGTLFKNREDVLRLVTSNYVTEDELEKRPLSKLKRDIAEELGLI